MAARLRAGHFTAGQPPHDSGGDTVLQAKDVLAVVAEGEALTMVEALCKESLA